MAFRDDRDAAHARADALARDLAERDEELARTQRALAEARVENEALAAAGERASRAQAQLDTMVSTAVARAEAEGKAATLLAKAKGDKRERARVKRMLLSVGTGLSWPVVAGALAALLAAVASRVAWDGSRLLALAAALLTVAIALACWRLQLRYERRRLAAEYEWAATRPYTLTNYPALLAHRPPRSDNQDRRGHSKLVLDLGFIGEVPAQLDTLVRAFDPQLDRIAPGLYRCRSPVTEEDESPNTADHNVAVVTWFRRCERELLEPLHRALDLQSVRIALED